MTDSDLLSEAMAQLYSSDLDEFTQRRGALAASARAAGQASVAKQIAGLRKPTRSDLADARQQARRANSVRRQARQALDRLRR